MSSAMLDYEQAAAMISGYAEQLCRRPHETEPVELADAAGRVLARALCADADQPAFARSTRDGFACRAVEAAGHNLLRVGGSTRAGQAPVGSLPVGSVWEIMTGAPVPPGADAVVMIEHVETVDGRVRLLPPRTIAAGDNVVARGAEARQGDELLPAGTLITFAQIAVAAACGHATLDVYARPRVAILATGDELVEVAATPAPGQIRNSNTPMLAAMVAAAGGTPWLLPTAGDNAASLDAALAQAVRADLLLISGGVSAGRFDLVEPALARAGAQFHFTGVRMQPGKPAVFGEMPRAPASDSPALSLPFFGLPGNPISSAVTFLLFAAPVIAALAGNIDPGPRFALARFADEFQDAARPGLTRFLPARCAFRQPGGSWPEVKPLPWQGSGDLAALARCNCFLVIPEGAVEQKSGDLARILLS